MIRKTLFATAALATLAGASTNINDREGIFGYATKWETGLINVDSSGSDTFYWLIDSQKSAEQDPLVLWMSGGPGQSSLFSVFYENGPWKFRKNGFSKEEESKFKIEPNPYSWNTFANMLYIDSPIGTGFSKAGDAEKYVSTTDEVVSYVDTFLAKFLDEHPKFKGRDFYIAGKSYSGRFVAALTRRLLAKEFDLNLKGIAIGNGDIDPYTQLAEYPRVAFENGLTKKSWEQLKEDADSCTEALAEAKAQKNDFMKDALMDACDQLEIDLRSSGKFNAFDFRLPCKHGDSCYNLSQSEKLLNIPHVQKVLGVLDRKWTAYSNAVYDKIIAADRSTSQAPAIADILDNSNVKVLVYYGDKDWRCSWRSGEAWTAALDWRYQKQFNATKQTPLKFEGADIAAMRQQGNLSFLQVYNAGHMVAADQPKAALEMFRRFIVGDWSETKAGDKVQSSKQAMENIMQSIF